jgi:hypothetical protein
MKKKVYGALLGNTYQRFIIGKQRGGKFIENQPEEYLKPEKKKSKQNNDNRKVSKCNRVKE